MKAELKIKRSMGLLCYLLVFTVGMIFLPGCGNSQSTASQDPPKINLNQENSNQNKEGMVPSNAQLTANDLETAIEANKGWQLIDIREPREFAAGHIKMAINRPLGDLEKKIPSLSKDKEIVLIDLNGTRSESAWQIFTKNGYDPNKVKILTGGMLEWNGIVSTAGNSSGANTNNANANSTNSGTNNAAAPKPEVHEMVGGC